MRLRWLLLIELVTEVIVVVVGNRSYLAAEHLVVDFVYFKTKTTAKRQPKPTRGFGVLGFWGFIPFDCLISSKIICFNTVKIGRSFVTKTKNTLKIGYFG